MWLKHNSSKIITKRYNSGKYNSPFMRGELAEWMALDFALKLGYDVVARKWWAPFGEVDLIAMKNGVFHFIEIKSRAAGSKYKPKDNVTFEKQKKYHSLAKYFFKAHHIKNRAARFHIVSVEFDEAEKKVRLEFLENAF